MSSWHEQVRPSWSFIIPPREGGRTGIVICRSSEDYDLFQAHFMRWEGKGECPAVLWNQDPNHWFELWPREPLLAPTMVQVEAAALGQLPQVDSARAEHQYDKQAYVPPPKPDRLETIDHASGLAKAVILKHSEVRFEVRYFSFMDFGGDTDYVRTAVPGSRYWDEQNRPIHWETLTLADDWASARQVAIEELEQVVQAARSDKPQDTFIQRVPRKR